jgi:hypothetical protein
MQQPYPQNNKKNIKKKVEVRLKYCKVPYKLKLNAQGYAVWTNVRATDCPDNNTKLVDSIASSSRKWDFHRLYN